METRIAFNLIEVAAVCRTTVLAQESLLCPLENRTDEQQHEARGRQR